MSNTVNLLMLTVLAFKEKLTATAWKMLNYLAVTNDGKYIVLRGPEEVAGAETITDLPTNVVNITAIQRNGNTLTWWTDADIPDTDVAMVNTVLSTAPNFTAILTDKKKFTIGAETKMEYQHAITLDPTVMPRMGADRTRTTSTACS